MRLLISFVFALFFGVRVFASLPAELCRSADSSQLAEIQQDLQVQLKAFSRDPLVAKAADATLSKLVAAKSPVIASWFQSRDLSKKSDHEVKDEWRIYFAKNFVLAKYPQEDARLNTKIEALVDGVFAKNFKAAQVKKFNRIFEEAKRLSLARVKEMPLAEAQKTQVLSRIEAVKLYWMKSFKDSKYKAYPLEAVSWGIAYDPVANEINMGIEALKYTDDQTLLAVFSHEIAHAFDSCRWGAFIRGLIHSKK